MKKIVFRGSGVAIVTPFNPDLSINYPKLGELIDWHIREGTDCIVICGTTGEASTLSDETQIECIRYTVERAAGRIPIVAGCGSNDTPHAVALSKEAKRVGADALLHVTPYYNKTSQRGLIRHYSTIADATDLPMIVYNVPGRTAMNITPDTYFELSKHPNIVATKEANGDIGSAARTIDMCGDELAFYSGNDDFIIPLMSLGGIGVISVIANILPVQTHQMTQLFLDGDTAGAAKLQTGLMGIIDSMFCDINPVPVKEALNLMGWEVGPCRLPLIEIDPAAKLQLAGQLKKHGLIK
ncbi:MAG: 4-hydroxy-tetrahydrodipicolinate synthase [Oscillospiraceae bacterium]|nr:4-hydroxy-tetrahydrodipicolinate synthase [Oscillospiraceae bacterium]